jgi:hypothetical protein
MSQVLRALRGERIVLDPLVCATALVTCVAPAPIRP